MSHRSILDLEEGETYHEVPNGVDNRNPSDKLKTFRDLVGINPVLDPNASTNRRPAQNEGTYKRLVDAEIKARLQYYASASLINFCLLAQIIIAAALTALGASAGSHVAVTVLGAVNTVIAGGMTYLKGQGLPERILQYANGLRRVREYLEERERQFARPDSKLDVDEEAKTVLEMYEAVRKNAEDSYAATWKDRTSPELKKKLEDKTGASAANGSGVAPAAQDTQGKKPAPAEAQEGTSNSVRDH